MPLAKRGPAHNQTQGTSGSHQADSEKPIRRSSVPGPPKLSARSIDSDKPSAATSGCSQAPHTYDSLGPSSATDDSDTDDWETQSSEFNDLDTPSTRAQVRWPGHNLVPRRFNGIGPKDEPGIRTRMTPMAVPYSPYGPNSTYRSAKDHASTASPNGSNQPHINGPHRMHYDSPQLGPYIKDPTSYQYFPEAHYNGRNLFDPNPHSNLPRDTRANQPTATGAPYASQYQQYGLPAHMLPFLVSGGPGPPNQIAPVTPAAEVDTEKVKLQAELKALKEQEQKKLESERQNKRLEHIVKETGLAFESLLKNEETKLEKLQAELAKHQAETKLSNIERSRIERTSKDGRDTDRSADSKRGDRSERTTSLGSSPRPNLGNKSISRPRKSQGSYPMDYLVDETDIEIDRSQGHHQALVRKNVEGDRSTIQLLELKNELLKLQHQVLLESSKRAKEESALHGMSNRRIASLSQKAPSLQEAGTPARAPLKRLSRVTSVNEADATSEDGEDDNTERYDVGREEQQSHDIDDEDELVSLSSGRKRRNRYEPSSEGTLGFNEVPPEAPEAPRMGTRLVMPPESDDDETYMTQRLRTRPSNLIPGKQSVQWPEDRYIERMRLELRMLREEIVEPVLKTLLVELNAARMINTTGTYPQATFPLQEDRVQRFPNLIDSESNQRGKLSQRSSFSPRFSLEKHLHGILSQAGSSRSSQR